MIGDLLRRGRARQPRRALVACSSRCRLGRGRRPGGARLGLDSASPGRRPRPAACVVGSRRARSGPGKALAHVEDGLLLGPRCASHRSRGRAGAPGGGLRVPIENRARKRFQQALPAGPGIEGVARRWRSCAVPHAWTSGRCALLEPAVGIGHRHAVAHLHTAPRDGSRAESGAGRGGARRSVEAALAPAQPATAAGASLRRPAVVEALAAEVGRGGDVGGRRTAAVPPPPPLSRAPNEGRGLPGPPGPPTGRGGRFSASFTRSGRPFRSRPFMVAMHFWAASSSSNSTKANPRGRPVSRSVGSLASTTLPAEAKAAMSSSRVTSKLRLPTKTLFEMSTFSLPASAVRRTNRTRVAESRKLA